MAKHMRMYRKISVAAACGILIVGALTTGPRTAHAQWVVSVPLLEGKELALDKLALLAGRQIIHSMSQSIINWINSGFEGSPAFITDLEENLGNLADTVAEDFLNELDREIMDTTGFSIRSPFQDQIAAMLREEFYRTTSSYGFDVRHPYTLRNYSSDPAAFTKGDFSKGGFDAWFKLSQVQENNPYGRYMLAKDELYQRIDTATKNRRAELEWGRGFLSWRGPCGPYANNQGQGADLKQTDKTANCPIRTPGTVIEESLGVTVTSPLRQLELADEINEIFAALMDQLMQQTLGGGGIRGLSEPSSGGGESFINRAGTAQSSLATGFIENIAQQRTQIMGYQSGWQRIAAAASSAQQACRDNGARAQEAASVLQVANLRLTEATGQLASLSGIEQRAQTLRNSTNTTEIISVVNEFQTLISQTGALSLGAVESQGGPGTLLKQMEELEQSCQ